MRLPALCVLLVPLVCSAGVPSLRTGVELERGTVLELQQDQRLAAGMGRAMEQIPGVVDEQAGMMCEDLQTPQPISTPAPALAAAGRHGAIRVNFVINTDGVIENPVVVLSGGARFDRIVTRTISRWRYRPAVCNGVPIQAEASIEFPAK